MYYKDNAQIACAEKLRYVGNSSHLYLRIFFFIYEAIFYYSLIYYKSTHHALHAFYTIYVCIAYAVHIHYIYIICSDLHKFFV